MFAHLSIYPATHDQAIESRKRSWEHWGKRYGFPDQQSYIDRPGTYASLVPGDDDFHSLVVWVLAPRNDPETLDFMCACEVYRRELSVSRQAGSNLDPTSEEPIGYGVGAVFTPPDKRGKGYAKHMMRLLHWVLAPASSFPDPFPEQWGKPPTVPQNYGRGVVSILWSALGPEYYKSCGPYPGKDGWTVVPNTLTSWDVETMLQRVDEDAKIGQWTFLEGGRVEEIAQMDSELITAEARTAPPPKHATFSFLPRQGLAQFWQFFVRHIDEPPEYWGIASRGSEEDRTPGLPFALWAYAFFPDKPRTLWITRLRCSKGLLPSVLFQIADYAKRFGIVKIEAWNLPDNLKEEAEKIGGCHTLAEGHQLASVKWYGEEDKVEWLNNER
ncbi:hypothetical protein DFP72DRAFT_567181 [Ephemerocybe angulata]|uniref:LYC1 C-terminal domain-containing protein n=1 Tax=Ephemerocybe angulata TaxID=980116 RepID=A0A8H6MB85_9AGAR|nr:hypothetical protein DFP72DRAFT_567181 [Tulosesus angulatus]